MSTFKLLQDYCAKHELPTPKAIVRYGTYGGNIGIVEIGDKTYKDNHERNQREEATEAASLLALRNLLNLN